MQVLRGELLGEGEGGVCTLRVDLHRQAAEAVHPAEESHSLLQGHALQDGLEEGLCGLAVHLGANHEGGPLSTGSAWSLSADLHSTPLPQLPTRALSHPQAHQGLCPRP